MIYETTVTASAQICCLCQYPSQRFQWACFFRHFSSIILFDPSVVIGNRLFKKQLLSHLTKKKLKLNEMKELPNHRAG